jgi:hypothetical protein
MIVYRVPNFCPGKRVSPDVEVKPCVSTASVEGGIVTSPVDGAAERCPHPRSLSHFTQRREAGSASVPHCAQNIGSPFEIGSAGTV